MDHEQLLILGTDLGCLLMESGAEIFRVEESMARLLAAYGSDSQVFAIPSCIILSITTPQGKSITRMCRIPPHGTDIELLERCNDLCRKLCSCPIPLDEARAQVAALREHRQYPRPIVLLSYSIASAFFALFFGGTWLDGVGAFLCGTAIGLCLIFGQKVIGSNAFFRTALCAAVASVLALALVPLGLGHTAEAVTIGSLMVLVPGMALTNAMREIMAGDVISGVNRTAEVILLATAIALGAAIPLVIVRLML